MIFTARGSPKTTTIRSTCSSIAGKAEIGVFAAQLGLISLYGNDYPDIPYLVKLNSKTNIVKTAQAGPGLDPLIDVRQVVEFKNNTGLNILGVGYTVYLGSEFENAMLREAAQAVHRAHHHGLLTVLWIYPRGKAVKDEKAPDLIAGATGVAACLGTDFVKVNYPKREGEKSAEIFKQAIQAAGRTKVVCAGGSKHGAQGFPPAAARPDFRLRRLGKRHRPQHPPEAAGRSVRLTNAITAITVYGKSVEEAFKIYIGGTK